MSDLTVYKLDDQWHFLYHGHLQKGFTSKDEAQMAGEKYIIECRKADAKKAKKVFAKKAPPQKKSPKE